MYQKYGPNILNKLDRIMSWNQDMQNHIDRFENTSINAIISYICNKNEIVLS